MLDDLKKIAVNGVNNGNIKSHEDDSSIYNQNKMIINDDNNLTNNNLIEFDNVNLQNQYSNSNSANTLNTLQLSSN